MGSDAVKPITLYRVEIDDLDEPIASIEWFATYRDACASARQHRTRRGEDDCFERYGRARIMAIVTKVLVTPTRDGLLEALRGHCATSEPS